jgi:tetratricopeptide (TPR) repeat protein
MASMPTFDIPAASGSAPTAGDSAIDLEGGAHAEEEGIDLDAAEVPPDEGGIDIDMTDEVPAAPPAKRGKTAMLGAAAAGALAAGAAARYQEEETEPEMEEAEEEGEEEGEEPALEEEEAQPTAEKPPSKRGAWLGGTALGLAAGVAACVGVWVFGVEPPSSLREMVGTDTGKKTSSTGPGPGAGGPTKAGGNGGAAAAPVTFAQAAAHLRNGDLDAVTAEMLTKADENKVEDLVARAEYRWLTYLKKERGQNPRGALKADDAAVTQALADLTKAVGLKSADALYLRGQIHQMTGKTDQAKADFAQGVKDFPDQKARFEAAQLTLDLKLLARAPGTDPRLRAAAERAAVAMTLLALQAPVGGGAATVPEEAGLSFWKAVKAAGEKNYAEAQKLIVEARDRHDRRRYQLLNKQQNPLSDPRELIFLISCDELKNYWGLLDYLKADPRDALAAVKELEKKAGAGQAKVLETLADKLAKGKPIAKAEDLIALVEAERKEAAGKVAALQEMVTEKDKKAVELAADLKKSGEAQAKSAKELEAAAAREKALVADKVAATAALKDVSTALEAKFEDFKDLDAVVKAARQASKIGRIKDPKGDLRRLEREASAARAALKESWKPGEMLAFWALLAAADRSNVEVNTSALKDVVRVLKDPRATKQEKGMAALVRGLVKRNQGKFAEAKDDLESAKTTVVGPLARLAEEALREVATPGKFYADQAQALESRGKREEALKVLARAIRSTDGDKAPLLARRSLMGLESARSKGRVAASDPVVAAARKDAAAAAATGSAEGHYAAGRVAEELGDLEAAIASYRQAVRGHPAMDAAGSRYRVALARVLLRSGGGAPAAPRAVPPATRTGRKETPPRQVSLTSREALLVLALLLQVDLPRESPATGEAGRLADEILAQGDKVPFDVRAQALAIKGLYTRALTEYTTGLRRRGLLAAEYANGLLDLIEGHPNLRRPDAPTTPDPAVGERHYAAGVNHFFARRYRDAEKELVAAVESDNGDARYFYFLGLARLAQGKRDGYQDFDDGARLERDGRPGQAAVSAALERVQGSLRGALNAVRNRPVRERPGMDRAQ